MKLSVYVAALAKIAEKYPDADVVYSRDDEGNGYQEVYFTPTPGLFNDGEFEKKSGKKVNAVCIN